MDCLCTVSILLQVAAVAEDISDRKIQFAIAKDLGLPTEAIETVINNGEAYAALSKDSELVKEHVEWALRQQGSH